MLYCNIEFLNKCDIYVTNYRKCTNGPDLLANMKNITFQGTSWPVEFDEFGDVKGRYMFQQYDSKKDNRETQVAIWDKILERITVDSV